MRQWVTKDSDLSVLFIGETHIIGSCFSADRL